MKQRYVNPQLKNGQKSGLRHAQERNEKGKHKCMKCFNSLINVFLCLPRGKKI